MDNSNADSVETDAKFFRRGRLSPELVLMEAVLTAAMHQPKPDLLWINRDDDNFLSFKNCCEHLGLDYLAARKALNMKFAGKATVIFKPRMVDHKALCAEIKDVPGKIYTHAYGECPDGVTCSNCHECRQRYNHRYRRLWRRRRTVVVERVAAAG